MRDEASPTCGRSAIDINRRHGRAWRVGATASDGGGQERRPPDGSGDVLDLLLSRYATSAGRAPARGVRAALALALAIEILHVLVLVPDMCYNNSTCSNSRLQLYILSSAARRAAHVHEPHCQPQTPRRQSQSTVTLDLRYRQSRAERPQRMDGVTTFSTACLLTVQP